MNNEINTPHGQHSPFSEHISPENSRNNSQLLPHSPPSRYSTIQQNSSPGNYQLRDGRHRSPITNTENHVGTPSPSRRPVGTFEYGHTYGSSTYRHDQTTFLGTPKLSTRYKPDNASFRQLSRPMHDNRRRQFSPFVHYPRFQEKPTQDENDERSTRKGPAPNSDDYRGRAFPVNHDWEESSTFQEPQQPKTYSACALTIWKVDEFCGFLCDKNALCTNLHFYADSTTVVEEDGKPLGELPSDRLQRGHRVEIEAELADMDVSDTSIHYMIHVRKLIKLGSAASLDLVYTQVLIPLVMKKPSSYFRALAENGDLVYIHPSILYASSLIDFMKQHMLNCRPPFVDNALEVLYSNHTIRGDVTVAPRWIGDTIGRMCNLKRILISCEPYGDTAQGYGTVVEAVSEWSIVVQSHSRSDRVHCSLLNTSPELKGSFKVGCHVRYTACLDLPNSTYKWRCLKIAKTSWSTCNEAKVIVENSDTKGISSSNVTNGITPVKPTLEQGNCLIDSRKERDERVTNRKWDAKVEIIEREKNSQNSHEAPNTKKSYSPPRRIYRPIGYPAEANDPIPICMIENPRKRFRYGDEPPCRFTIPDEAERNHYAMYSSLYKSMEDFLLRHKHRREKNMRRSSRNVSATKSCELDREEIKKEDQFNTPSEDTTQRTTVDDSPKRFHFVGTGDDIGEIMASPKNCPKSPTKPSPSVKCSSDGWWYRRKRPRIYPTVVVAEFIEKRDVEKDCNEDVNVYRLPKTLTIRNSGVFVDDGICADSSGAMPNSRNSNPIISQNKDDQPSIMSLIQNDDVIGKFFAPLLKGPPKA
uniref:C3H1-type domain-containing protein n=1 Tax=Haemonchus contortus TaxID=6289 RepID=A0A7I5EB00_HAECO